MNALLKLTCTYSQSKHWEISTSVIKKGKTYTLALSTSKKRLTLYHTQDLRYQKHLDQNISGKFLALLKDIYKKTKCAVKINNFRTNFFTYTKWLRQGDPLSPLLFNIYINDLFNITNKANPAPVTLDGTHCFSALGYADDIVFLSTPSDGLQRSINSLQTFFGQWKLNINHKTTMCLTIHSLKGIKKKSITFYSMVKYLKM